MNESIYLIDKIETPANDLVVIDLVRPNNQPVFDYKPGQFVLVSFRNSRGQIEEKHAFSLASSPTDRNRLQLGIRVGGRFTRGLLKLKAGDSMAIYGPYGAFSFDERKHHDAVFLAGGIGITPFLSAIRYISDKNLPNQATLVHSNRKISSAPFKQEIDTIVEKNKNIKAFFSVTDEQTDMPGIINKSLDFETLSRIIGTTEGKSFFLCGPAPFMAAMKKHLLALGASDSQVFMEEFAMISNGTPFKKLAYFASLVGWSAAAMILPFYLIYAANTKTVSGQPLLDDLFKDNDEADTEKVQTVLGEIREYLPVVDRKSANKGTATQAPSSQNNTKNNAAPTPSTGASGSTSAQSPASQAPSTNSGTPAPTTGASSAAGATVGGGTTGSSGSVAPTGGYEREDD